MLQRSRQDCRAQPATERRQFAERCCRLLPALRIALTDRRQNELFEECSFAFGGATPMPKVSRIDAASNEPRSRRGDRDIAA